ncbi:MAG: SIMPL domain-containing protein [candidate division WOR-3 bacterium]
MKRLIIFLFTIMLFAYAQESLNTIVVRGEGVIEQEADLAIVQLGVSLQDRTADKAYKEVNRIVNEIIKAVSRVGIKKEDIKTASIGLYPQYEFPEGTQRLIGYQMYHNLSLRVRDIRKLADVIDFATVAGANTISSISFGFQDPAKLESQARVMAINDATQKAQAIAKATNLNLGRIVQIIEDLPSKRELPYYVGAGGPDGNEIMQGANIIKVAVTITYEIINK